MSIITRTRPPVNRKSAPARKTDLTVSLCLAIDHQAYMLTPIHGNDPDVTRAWRLEKKGSDGAIYDVATTIHGHQCDCPDWETRRNGIDPSGCKHIKACVRMGLLDAIPTGGPTALSGGWVCRNGSCDGCQTDAARDPEFSPPCFAADEPVGCQTCQTSTPATDAATSLVERGVALAKALAAAPDVSIRHDTVTDAGDDGANLTPPEIGKLPESTASSTSTGKLPIDLGPALDTDELFNEDGYIDPFDFPDDPDAGTWELGPEPDWEPSADWEPSDEDEADFAAWKQESAARDHLDLSERLTLAELVDRQSDFYRAWGNPAGEMVAAAMDRLAMQVRLTQATTPAELADRVDSLETDARETWEAAGYEAGRQAGCRCSDVVLG